MSEEYPLFPELPEDGNVEAVKLIEAFKKELSIAADNAIGALYCDLIPHIESDSWTNYRNHLMEGFRDYGNRKVQGEYDFGKIRETIYKEYRDELIVDLNQDLVKENESLKEQVEFLRRVRHGI